VLVHGLGLDHRMWERQVPALEAAGHHTEERWVELNATLLEFLAGLRRQA
jgi:hypothetical protein